jgi:hypothetical protein
MRFLYGHDKAETGRAVVGKIVLKTKCDFSVDSIEKRLSHVAVNLELSKDLYLFPKPADLYRMGNSTSSRLSVIRYGEVTTFPS